MALGLGYGLPFSVKRPVQSFAEDVALSVNNALADAAQREEAGNCLTARAMQIMQDVQTQPSLLIVPQLYKAGVLYDQLPTTRTNFIQNNTMVGATGSVRPNLWDIGSLPSGFTVSYSASGQTTAADGTLVDYIDVTVSGTALASGFLNLRQTTSPSPVSGNLLFASGMTYTASVYLALLSGSLTGVATNVMALQEIANTTFVANTTFAPVTGITSELTRFTGTRTIEATGGADRTSVRWGHSIVSGTSYDYTVRIASPQLEKGSVATPVIRTASGFVTVDAGGTARDGAPPDFTVSRNTTATRVNSSGLIESVASGVPRIDWLGQSCPALLVEASGQNQALWSRDLSVSGTWVASGITAVRNAIGADGTASGATTLTATAASATITQNILHLLQSRIFSAYMRRVSGSGQIQLTTNGGINWQTVTLTSAFAPFNSGAQTVVSGQVGIRMIASGDVIEVDFTQAEVGPIATSPIPTTTAAVSRAADVISASGALVSGLIGQTEGTVYAEVDIRSFGNVGILATISDGTASNLLTIYKFTDGKIYFDRISATQSATTTAGSSATYTAPIILKIAIGYKSGDTIMYINGVAATTQQTQTFTFGTLTKVNIGSSRADGIFFNDRIRAAALYTTRLSNDQLAELTRL